MDGILVPGGFGQRGTEGKILAIGYARRNKIPYLGLCLGMQLAIVEFARNVAGLSKAASIELDPETPDPVIALMPEQNGITNLGGTLRLGAYPCVLQPETLAHKLYGKTEISERHRHRYEVNNDYREVLTKNGMVLSGLSPDGRIVEMIELKEHPFFVATQFTGLDGKYVPIAETIRGFKEILEGKYDDIPESYFLNCGGIEDVLAKVNK